jgi:4-amino-4-deoxy-L-arabinose transferase-like glycosyltransferase
MQLKEEFYIQNLREETKDTGVLAFLSLPLVRLLVGLLVVGLTTFGLRIIYLDRSFDIFIDEITYLRIGQNVAANLQLTLYGQPFFLHPPAFFYLEAAFLHLFNPPSDTLQQIYSLRILNVTFATLTSLVVFLIVRHLTNWKFGLVAGGIFAIEQFIIKMNSMVMLDTTAIWWIVAGYGVLITGMNRRFARNEEYNFIPAPKKARKFRSLPGVFSKPLSYFSKRLGLNQPLPALPLTRTIPAGLFFGLALLTKDMTAFLSLLPLAICFGLNWSLNRRNCIQVGAVTILTYLVYPVSVFLTGSWDPFSKVKLHGLFRLTGVVKETGITPGNHGSFIQVLVQNIDKSGTTYFLILGGALATFFVLLFGNRLTRLVVTWAGSSYLMLAFSVVAGSLEEQFFYFLIVSSIISIILGISLLYEKRAHYRKIYPALLVVVVITGIFYASDNIYEWKEAHLRPNDGYAEVLNYLHNNLPVGTRVAATSETAQFLLEDYKSGPFGKWSDPQELGVNHAQYLLVSFKQLNWDEGATADNLLNWARQNGVLVYRFDGDGDGPLLLYRL